MLVIIVINMVYVPASKVPRPWSQCLHQLSEIVLTVTTAAQASHCACLPMRFHNHDHNICITLQQLQWQLLLPSWNVVLCKIPILSLSCLGVAGLFAFHLLCCEMMRACHAALVATDQAGCVHSVLKGDGRFLVLFFFMMHSAPLLTSFMSSPHDQHHLCRLWWRWPGWVGTTSCLELN